MEKIPIVMDRCREHWSHYGVIIRDLVEVSDFIGTQGKMFYTSLNVACGTREKPFNRNMTLPTAAYHGSSLSNVAKILRDNNIMIGPNCREINPWMP